MYTLALGLARSGAVLCAVQDYQRLLGTQPTRRLNPSKIAESSVIKNKLVDTIAFLENMSVKVMTCLSKVSPVPYAHQLIGRMSTYY